MLVHMCTADFIDLLLNWHLNGYNGLMYESGAEPWKKSKQTPLKGPFFCSKRYKVLLVKIQDHEYVTLPMSEGYVLFVCEEIRFF